MKTHSQGGGSGGLRDGAIKHFGPDALLPATELTSTRLDEPVKLRMTESNSKYKPISIYTTFKRTVDAQPNHPALAFRENITDEWSMFSWAEYWRVVRKAAKSFIKFDLQANECVGIVGFNSPHWFISLLGTIFAGGVGCGIYATNSAEACEHNIQDSAAQIVVVEDRAQLQKMLKLVGKPGINIRLIVQYSGTVPSSLANQSEDDGPTVISWSEFIEAGLDIDDLYLNERIKTLAPNKCASLIYTSGTTGKPKAAMISHDNIIYTAQYMALNQCKLKKYSERLVSYLPLSHIAAQLVDIFVPLFMGATVYFAQADALKGTLQTTLQDARPTMFFGVPRVWEKFQEAIQKALTSVTGTKLSLLNWSRQVTASEIEANFLGKKHNSSKRQLAHTLVLKAVQKRLGLDACRQAISGAAPITRDTLDFFISLGIPLVETYGMSETSGPHSVGQAWSNRIGSIGPTDPLNRSRLHNKDEEGSGELLIAGRHVMMGYLNNREKTNETFTEDFEYLHTGDIAKISRDAFLFITGRLKELIITAGGENVSPVPIEDNLKSKLPRLVSNCMLIGDKRKFLIVLITLKSNVDMDTMLPLDSLTKDCIEYLKSIGVKQQTNTVTDIVNRKDKVVHETITKAIKQVNEKSTSNASKIQNFIILPRDFSLVNGELGPTLKLRRPNVNKIYAETIEEFYESATAKPPKK